MMHVCVNEQHHIIDSDNGLLLSIAKYLNQR